MYIPHNIRYIKISYSKCSNTSVNNCTMFFFSRTIIGRDRCLSSRLARWTRYRTTRRKNVRPEIFCPMLTSNSKLCQHHQACIHCFFFFFFACFSQRLSTIVRATIATLVPWWTKHRPSMNLSTVEKYPKYYAYVSLRFIIEQIYS